MPLVLAENIATLTSVHMSTGQVLRAKQTWSESAVLVFVKAPTAESFLCDGTPGSTATSDAVARETGKDSAMN